MPLPATAVDAAVAPFIFLKDVNDRQYASGFRDKVTLVHFWATWCTPCRREIPALLQATDALQGAGLQLLLVAADSRQAVRTYLADRRWNATVLIDQYGSALQHYRIDVLPTTVVVDRQGLIVETLKGEMDWHRAGTAKRLQRWLHPQPGH